MNWKVWPMAQVSRHNVPPVFIYYIQSTATKFPIYTSTLPHTLSIYLWYLLDTLSITNELKVTLIALLRK